MVEPKELILEHLRALRAEMRAVRQQITVILLT
jgi:hypothetical protein